LVYDHNILGHFTANPKEPKILPENIGFAAGDRVHSGARLDC
jgi:hypothetical protein